MDIVAMFGMFILFKVIRMVGSSASKKQIPG